VKDFLKGSQLSTLARVVRILAKSDRKKIIAIAIVQICMSFLDLMGVLLIGFLGALAVAGIESEKQSTGVTTVLRFLQLSESSFQTQVLMLAISAVILLVGRTLLSVYFTRRILFFFSRRGASISANLVARLLSQPLMLIQGKTTQEMLYALTLGVDYIAINILATSMVLVADLSLLIVIGVGLFVVDANTAMATLTLFAMIGLLLFRLMHIKVGDLGASFAELSIKSNDEIVEVLSSYREAVVRNRRDYYSREIRKMRNDLADISAEINFMPYISKYVIETTMLVGGLLLAASQFFMHDSIRAVTTLGIFLAAGTRITPAVLRIQQGSLQIQASIGRAGPTLDLIDSLGSDPIIENLDDSVNIEHQGFKADVQLKNVSIIYPGKSTPALDNVNLTIPPGISLAIVGPSGAGKTTLVDILLGVLEPTEGAVSISGVSPIQAITKWPGAISYVPQDVMISKRSIRENIALGYPNEVATDELIRSALDVSLLAKFVDTLPQGINTLAGERGAKVSGGQRQRLGIARAMFTKPQLLVLDEATSALDGETEASITKSIQNLRGSTTVVMIAHRLSTVRDADIVVYMAEGKIVATGTFEEVRKAVPDFNRQAKLMGL
jgi:ABC-type multidrug transport system fused ATPase/permease subunit